MGSPPAGGAYIALFRPDRSINSAAYAVRRVPGAINTLTQQLGYREPFRGMLRLVLPNLRPADWTPLVNKVFPIRKPKLM